MRPRLDLADWLLKRAAWPTMWTSAAAFSVGSLTGDVYFGCDVLRGPRRRPRLHGDAAQHASLMEDDGVLKL